MKRFWICSDPGGVINIADPMTGTFVFIRLGYLKNSCPMNVV